MHSSAVSDRQAAPAAVAWIFGWAGTGARPVSPATPDKELAVMSSSRRRAADAAAGVKVPVSRSRAGPGIGVAGSGTGAGAAVTLPEAGPVDRRVIWVGGVVFAVLMALSGRYGFAHDELYFLAWLSPSAGQGGQRPVEH